ncbi:bifunctional 4-hydroxy-3-methylbut-2-enyl diphosphate reductase/30S ribosomal protein S1 [Halarsenatibacter silvermanii]|nr:bifunctional 4-hydroxy-3-methylbut-2-enyl diphosphate reductase/30S ribosomal protein S1 [Halarsenatibacter silvermanii]
MKKAEEAGFCFGVERAVEMAVKAAKSNDDGEVYTLGPIIHNPQVVNKLEKLGVRSAESLEQIDNGVIIIRSHGVRPDLLKQARSRGLKIIDATCPFVKKAQENASHLVENGYQTLIYGDKDHPEVRGILGAADEKAVIIENEEMIDDMDFDDKVGIVAQTTKSPSSYRRLVSNLVSEIRELKVFNTICNTTQTRQKAALKLAGEVEVMFVIGGHNSANTTRLAEMCSRTNTPTYHIETEEDIEWSWLNNVQKIGVTAGASTPDWLIKEVIQAMSEEEKDLEMETKENEETELSEENEEVEVELEEEEPVQEELEESDEAEEADQEVNAEEDVEEEEAEAKQESEHEEEDETEVMEPTTQEEMMDANDLADIEKGELVEGTVVEINERGAYVDVNYKSDGFIPLRELSTTEVSDPHEVLDLDEEVKVVVLTLEDEDGNMVLSRKRAEQEEAWESIQEAHENDEIIEAEITKEVKGGLVADVGLRGFIPASHVAIGYVEDLSQYVGEELKLRVIEVDKSNNNVVLSHKEVLEEKREKQKEETLAELEEGQKVTGEVTKLVDFGAFVDLGGIEGLLHISEMSWGRIGHPSDVLSEGEDIEVKVLDVNREEERISLGLKQLLPDPWEEFAEKHYEGEIIEGRITKIVDFGAFMEIEDGIEGLIHISQLSERHVETPDEVVEVDEERKAKIINIDPEDKRVGLSLKELEDEHKPQTQTSEKTQTQEKADEDSASDEDEDLEDVPSGATIGERLGDLKDMMDE